jgi:hypothetical protein
MQPESRYLTSHLAYGRVEQNVFHHFESIYNALITTLYSIQKEKHNLHSNHIKWEPFQGETKAKSKQWMWSLWNTEEKQEGVELHIERKLEFNRARREMISKPLLRHDLMHSPEWFTVENSRQVHNTMSNRAAQDSGMFFDTLTPSTLYLHFFYYKIK